MRPQIIGLAGASGSGKSTLAQALYQQLKPWGCAIVPMDAYYRDLHDIPLADRGTLNFDAPEALEIDKLVQDISDLQQKRGIRMPVYDFTTHTRQPQTQALEPTTYTIVEGVFALALPDLRQLFDLSIQVDTPPDICLLRRLRRDLAYRGRSVEEVLRQYEQTVRPSLQKWVWPAGAHANLRIEGTTPVPQAVQSIMACLA